MSLENTQLLASPDSPEADAVAARPRKVSTESSIARNRREVIALDGLMFESGSSQDELTPETLQHQSGPGDMNGSVSVDDPGLDNAVQSELRPGDNMDSNTLADTSIANAKDLKADETLQATSSEPLSPTSSTTSSSLSPNSPGTPSEFSARNQYPAPISRQQLQADLPRRSLSLSKRQSMFLGDHIVISGGSESPSDSPGSNDDQEDMKEVQIETADPSHLFWVPFHLHPEIAPNEYNKLLSKHGSTSQTPDGIPASRKSSVSRRRSVLSAQYNPEEDLDEQPSRPPKLSDETESHDFLSGVFTLPLEQMGEPPLKTRTSLRRSVSLSVSSPTRAEFPADTLEEDLIVAKKTGGLERGGLSLLRRSARTKLRRNSTASNDSRPDLSRLRQTVNANGEYTAVSLVDHGPQPLPSAQQTPEATTNEDQNKARKDGESVPVKRFVSTLRDSSKPTITTYVEPHLLEQQRRDNAEAGKDNEEAPLSFRISAPGKLESPIEVILPVESAEGRDRPDNYTVSYPIPPPVKLTQNLLQQPSTGQPSPAPTQSPSKPSHSKKPSTWSWLWGKEKGGEKMGDPSAVSSNNTTTPSAQSTKANNASQPSSNPETNTQTPSTEVTVKKQSTLSMLFSRNGKSTSSKSNSTSSDGSRSSSSNGFNGQSGQEKPKYSNYNRFPIHVERAIYRLSHVKLANPRRPLQEQVLISNMMFWYLGVIQQQQVQQQQQAEMQQRQQQESQESSDSKDEAKEPKAKKPKKRKSQKKKNQVQHQQYQQQQPQRGSSKAAERFAKNLQQEKQQQQQQQQLSMNAMTGQGVQPIQQGANLPSMSRTAEKSGRQSSNQQIDSDPDSQEESDGDESYPEQRQQHTLTPSSYSSETEARPEDEEEDDDVPLAHYQNMQRQTARGPKKHLKRLNAPKHWMLDKLTGTYAPRPSAGPHKLRECLPLIVLLRNRLKYALNGKEVQSILMQRLVKVDGKVRTDTTYPTGFMDVITIDKTGENFRLVYDTKGRFTVHRITAEESQYKLCKVKKVQLGAKGIPFVVTHDGRTLRYPDPLIKVNDTIKLDLESGKFNEFIKFEIGNVAMVTGGRNTGRVGVITHRERHVGGFDIVHIKDVLDRQFATRLSNVFVIGEGSKAWVSLPKNKGVKLTIAEERDRRRAAN
ncbi:40S ribosomal protein S4 [Mortierella sp. NVP85]|nr:40S ribosomal protein S4 [Mortierella sp. NVP85]